MKIQYVAFSFTLCNNDYKFILAKPVKCSDCHVTDFPLDFTDQHSTWSLTKMTFCCVRAMILLPLHLVVNCR